MIDFDSSVSPRQEPRFQPPGTTLYHHTFELYQATNNLYYLTRLQETEASHNLTIQISQKPIYHHGIQIHRTELRQGQRSPLNPLRCRSRDAQQSSWKRIRRPSSLKRNFRFRSPYARSMNPSPTLLSQSSFFPSQAHTSQNIQLATEAAWGSIWTRPGLDLKTRSLLNIAMLCALNRGPELAVHTRGALNNGASEVEIREVILQAAVYAGMPAGMEGTKVAEKAIIEWKEKQ